MYFILYDIGIFFYGFIAKLLSLFQVKARKWVEGRQNLLEYLQSELQTKKIKKNELIWFHCSSLGEFEQGRPLIEAIKEKYPKEKILLTFFSPSGYDIQNEYAYADIVAYLPLDTKKNARDFVKLVQPKMVFWVKYEFWYYLLENLHHSNIPVFLISGIFRPNHFFFSPFGKSHRQCLYFFEHIFVQNSTSRNLLEKLNIKNITVAGDTRLDRVLMIADENRRYSLIEQFADASDKPIIICGSTWPADDDIIVQYINNNRRQLPYRFIIAPHEIEAHKINALKKKIKIPAICYSGSTREKIGNFDVLIIDNIGMLSALYRYGYFAYIGGAFGTGLHNILEPIVFGLPVVFGRNYQKFDEAISIINNKGGVSIKNIEEFSEIAGKFLDTKFYQQTSKKARQYVTINQGATSKIMHSLCTSKHLK